MARTLRPQPAPCGDGLPGPWHVPLLQLGAGATLRRPWHGHRLAPCTGFCKRCVACSGFLLGFLGLTLLGGLSFGIGARTLFSFAFLAFALFALFAFLAFFGQFLFLLIDHLCLLAHFLFPANQVLGDLRSLCRAGGCFRSHLGGVVALDECALLAHFHLDGAGLASGIGLLDLAGGLLIGVIFFLPSASEPWLAFRYDSSICLSVSVKASVLELLATPAASCSNRVSGFFSSLANSATVFKDILRSILPDPCS